MPFAAICDDYCFGAGKPGGPRVRQNAVLTHTSRKYNFLVARGWESKSVEEQQAQAAFTVNPTRPPLTPAEIANVRRKQGLTLSRQHVLQQLEAAKNPRHREVLQNALAELDRQLAQLV